jgi:hypothetical protein
MSVDSTKWAYDICRDKIKQFKELAKLGQDLKGVKGQYDDVGCVARMVLLYFADAEFADGQTFPSYDTLALWCNVKDPRTIREAIKELEGAGLITRTARYRVDGGQTSYRYTLIAPHLDLFAPPPPQKMQGGISEAVQGDAAIVDKPVSKGKGGRNKCTHPPTKNNQTPPAQNADETTNNNLDSKTHSAGHENYPVENFHIARWLGNDGLAQCMIAAPDLEASKLMEKFNKLIRNGSFEKPQEPKAAFIAYCEKQQQFHLEKIITKRNGQ